MRLLALVLLVATAASSSAQQAAPFARIDVPNGVPPGVNSLGKLVHFVDNGNLFVFSANTRQWASTPVGATWSTHATNDIVLLREPSRWTAFGASRGRFAPLSVSPSAQLENPLSQTNDSVLLVRDGSLLHAFSGFTGRWVTRSIAPSGSVVVQRHVALLTEPGLVPGTTLCSGFDAFTGQWRDLAVLSPVTRVSVDGVCGFVTTADAAHGFSALRSSWTSAPAPANANSTIVRNDDWVVLHDGALALGYSGLTNTFASQATGALLASAGDDLVAVLTAPGLAHAFSPFTATWSAAPLSAPANVRVTTASALIVDGQQLLAYSSPRSVWVPLSLDSSGETVAGSVLAAEERSTGRAYLFSALTAGWQAAPLDANAGLPSMATTGALLASPTGGYAFSARSGAFVHLVSAGLSLHCNANSAPMLAWDAGYVHAFDARRDRWLSVPRTGTATCDVHIWRTNAFVLDGNEVLSFSSQGGAIARATLSEPIVSFRANSESASLSTAHSVVGLSGLPEPSCVAQFPDFRRVAGIGAPVALHLRLMSGDVALLGYGPSLPVPLALPNLGTMLLDPQALAVQFLVPEADADRAIFAAHIPDDPVLRFQSVWFQALVAPAAGTAY
ncbi:MAG: hypothetical protein ABL997_16540, partial [Planctomycetota bacterium]